MAAPSAASVQGPDPFGPVSQAHPAPLAALHWPIELQVAGAMQSAADRQEGLQMPDEVHL